MLTWSLGDTDAGPDIALVQQAPRGWRWRSKCARLAREAGLVVITGGRPAAGNLLLCAMRVRVLSAQDVRRPRGAVLAVVQVDGNRLSVRGTRDGLVVDRQ
jgi:hypothetical protein